MVVDCLCERLLTSTQSDMITYVRVEINRAAEQFHAQKVRCRPRLGIGDIGQSILPVQSAICAFLPLFRLLLLDCHIIIPHPAQDSHLEEPNALFEHLS